MDLSSFRQLHRPIPRSSALLVKPSALQLRVRSCPGPRLPTQRQPLQPCHSQPPAQFDLPLAVALAGTAFEAYLQPLGAAGFEDKALNGAQTIFMDRQFLSSLYQGILYVELKSASDLRAADFTGSSDPYAVLSVGNSSGKSAVKKQTLNPLWNSQMWLYVRDTAKDMLKIRVYDEDFLKSDDELGLAMIPLAALEGKGAQDLDVPLGGSAGAQGRVQLRLTYLAFHEFPEDVQRQLTATKAVLPEHPEVQSSQDMAGKVPQIIENMVKDSERRRRRAKQSSLTSWVDSGLDALKGKVQQAAKDLAQHAAQQLGPAPPPEPPSPWKVLATMVGEAASAFTPLAFVEHPDTDTQLWIFANRDKREVVVAFRGTEQVKWKDLATDMNLTPTDLNPERLDSDAGVPLGLRLIKAALGNKDMRVHTGFLTAYDSVRQQVVALVDALTREAAGGGQPWRVMVTGHSLGGALATLCAFELSARQGPIKQTQRITMYSFGAPRVGNQVFAQQYDTLVPDSWRIANSNDIVPSVPRLLGYAHVKHSVSVAPCGTLVVQADSKDVFGEGRSGVDVLQELVDRVNTQNRPWEEVYDEIAAREMEMFNALVDGSALEEHMETFYLETLKACVLASGKAKASNE